MRIEGAEARGPRRTDANEARGPRRTDADEARGPRRTDACCVSPISYTTYRYNSGQGISLQRSAVSKIAIRVIRG